MAKKKVEAPAVVEAPIADILTIENWKNSPALQAELRRILETPVFKKACATLLMSIMPNSPASTEVEPGVSAEVLTLRANNLYHNRSGFGQALRALPNLAKLKAVDNSAKPHFGTLLPEDE